LRYSVGHFNVFGPGRETQVLNAVLSLGGLYLVWILLCGVSFSPTTTSTPPDPTPTKQPTKRERRLTRRLLSRLLYQVLPRQFRYKRRLRHLHLVTKVHRRPGGWLTALQLRLRLRLRAASLVRRMPALFLPSLSRRTSGHPYQATFTSSAPWLLSSSYQTDHSDPSMPEQPYVLLADGAYPIVIDTGASISVTPNASDFVRGISTSSLPELRGLNHTSKVS
jgi:hypothetical protein